MAPARNGAAAAAAASHSSKPAASPPAPAPAAAAAAAAARSSEWNLLWLLYSSGADPAAQEALCADLLARPPEALVAYLLQLVYLAVARPASSLERALTQLCGRSFNIAVQVSWLLLALLQDQPGNRHIRLFKDACERAALSGGSWVSPFEQAAHQQQQVQVQQHRQQDDGDHTKQEQSNQQQQQQPTHASGGSAAAGEALGSSISTTNAQHSPACSSGGARPAAPSAPSAAAAAAAAPPPAAAGGSSRLSLDAAHRFRNSLDLELMRAASGHDLSTASPTTGGSSSAGAEEVSAAGAGAAAAGAVVGPAATAWASPGAGSSSRSGAQGGLQEQQQQQQPALAWTALPGTVASRYPSFDAYLDARRAELSHALGPDEGVSSLIEASFCVAQGNGPEGMGWVVSHEEDLTELLSLSALLSAPPRCPALAAARDAYLATLDFVEALCDASSNLTRFPHADRLRVLQQCLTRISLEVEAAAAQGVDVRYPIGGCTSRVLRLLVSQVVVLNSRDKAPFLLLLEAQQDGGVQGFAGGGAAGALLPPRGRSNDDAGADGLQEEPRQQQQQANSRHSSQPRRQQRSSSGGGHARHRPSPLSRATGPSGGSGTAEVAAEALTEQQQQHQQHGLAVDGPEPSQLEVQMQEAAALLRGEQPARLVRLTLRVRQRARGSSGGQQPGASGGSNEDDSLLAVTLDVVSHQSLPQLPLSQHPAGADGSIGSSSSGGGNSAPGGQAQLPRRRRLPSQEAIDIIAGKLGRDALPAPPDIGVPLHLGQPTSAHSSGGSDNGASTAAAAAGAASSAAHVAPQQQRSPAADNWQHVPQSPAAAGAVQSGSVPPPQQQQQQQQAPPAPPTLWGRLFGSSSAHPQHQQRHQQPTQQQQLPGAQAPWQQQQQQPVSPEEAAAAEEHSRQAAAVFGDSWSDVCAHAAAASPDAASTPGWRLAGAIIKSGDDCRQELLALQLIREFAAIWAAAGLPLYVRPFDVLVTSADTALIELIPDAASLHTIKARYRRLLSAAATNSSSSGGGGGAAGDQHHQQQQQQQPQPQRGSSGGGGGGGGTAAAPKPPLTPSKQQQQQEAAGVQQQAQQQRPARSSWSGRLGGGSGSTEQPAGGGGDAAARTRRSSAGSIPASPTRGSVSVSSPSAAAAQPPPQAREASLSEFFFARWRRGSPECLQAQRRFVESLAGYSLVCYLLQVKDRHNGNIMLDADGRLVHIDFGFMLSNTPGGGWVRFEAAPMKLSREMLEIMDSSSDGTASELFDYFKVLCIQGFLAARRQRQRVTGLVRIMADCCRPPPVGPGAAAAAAATGAGGSSGGGSGGGGGHAASIVDASSSSSSLSGAGASQAAPSGAAAAAGGMDGAAGAGALWPCFRAGPGRVLAALEARFLTDADEAACVQHVLQLISASLDAWSTRTYDYYQRVLNGIL